MDSGSVETSLSNNGIFKSPKGRKVDDDGFVKPSTPDIPKKSLHYNHLIHQDQYTCFHGDSNQEHVEESPELPDESGDTSSSNNQMTTLISTFTDEQDLAQNNVLTEEESECSSKEEREFQNIEEIIQDLHEKTSKVYMHWIEKFRGSEKYEEEMPMVIDDLLLQARAMEQDLINQKENLRRRLQEITNTLRLS